MAVLSTWTRSAALLVVLSACGSGEGPAADAVPEETAVDATRAPFVGTWSLTRSERFDAAGEPVSEPIEDRVGYLIYDAAGYMGVTLMWPDRAPYSEDGPTADEALAQMGSYISYFGRFTVDEAEGVVRHHLEGAIWPGRAGEDFERGYTFGDGTLTLQPPASEDGSYSRLTWTREPDLPASDLTDIHPQLFGAYRIEEVTVHTTDGFQLEADQYETAYILYAASGHMSVHLARPDRTPYAGDEPTAEEALAAVESYGSYFGPFSVNLIAGCLTCPGPRDQGYLVHHRVGSENPNDSGVDARRYFELTDTHLTLRPPVRVDDEGRQLVTAIRWARLVP